MRKFRYIVKGKGKDSLTEYERQLLTRDLDIDLDGYHILVSLSKKEFEALILKKQAGSRV